MIFIFSLKTNQFGFITGRSIDDTLFSIKKCIYTNLDSNNKVLSIFLDVKKAFDYINHEILLKN
jgi:hypothetical protein